MIKGATPDGKLFFTPRGYTPIHGKAQIQQGDLISLDGHETWFEVPNSYIGFTNGFCWPIIRKDDDSETVTREEEKIG